MCRPLVILRVGLVTLLVSCVLFAQVQPNASAVKALSTKPAPTKVKLTPDQQRGLRLLKQSEVQAASLEPDMRAYVLWRVADGCRKVDRAKADAALDPLILCNPSP